MSVNSIRFFRKGWHTRLSTVAVAVASLTSAALRFAQEHGDTMAVTVGQFFAMIQQSFVSLADAMRAEKYGFKPTDGQFDGTRTFGEQVKHVACANFAFFNEIEKKEPPPLIKTQIEAETLRELAAREIASRTIVWPVGLNSGCGCPGPHVLCVRSRDRHETGI